MKRINAFLPLLLVLPSFAMAFNSFRPQTESITFSDSVPPAIFYVVDSQGRRAGANPALPVDKVGIQGDGVHGLEEIPGSVADQQNIGNDRIGGPSKHTSWFIMLPDNGKQIYTVVFKGIATGEGRLDIYASVKANAKAGKKLKIPYLITANTTRKITVSYNPKQSLTFKRVVEGGDLLADVKSACKLNLIPSDKVCKRLTKKADAIQDAIQDHKWDKAEGLLKSFLCNLGDLQGHGDDDDDCHSFIKEPALTILKEDAKALLKTVDDHDGHH